MTAAGKTSTLAALAEELRNSAVFRAKTHIRPVAELLGSAPSQGGIRNGDDAAAIPDRDGWLLLAADGILPALVERDPYLAGRCAVLANVNDIYAMGGRPTAMVDVLGATSDAEAAELCRGLRDGAARYGVPLVGGHVLRALGSASLAVAILGRARSLITSFDARPGDRLVLVANRDGRFLEPDGFWNATLARNDAALLPNLELLPAAAEAGLVQAGKDVSMSGVAGTLVMLAETSGVGARLCLDALEPPGGVPVARWLLAFMSYGFLLAVRPEDCDAFAAPFLARGLEAGVVGEITDGSRVFLAQDGHEVALWDWRLAGFTGFSKP
jgi:AIR synthase-related protein